VSGVLVFNLHPQNVDSIRTLHKEVILLSKRSGWMALGLESYLDWLFMLDNIQIECTDRGFLLKSNQLVENLAIRYPKENGWHQKILTSWSNQIYLDIPKCVKYH
jgi:hypothetical protein